MAEGKTAMSDSLCQACSGQWPKSDYFLADLGVTRAYLHDDQFFPGWTILVFQRHATELFHLTAEERSQMIEEISRVAQILTEIYAAKKINYELLGNQTPHIHWHLIPRLHEDPAPREPVWRVPHAPVTLTGSTLHEAVTRLAQPLRKIL